MVVDADKSGDSQPSASSNDLALDLHHVTKIYRRKIHALRGIEMQVHPGEVFGLLGPNGAGKSTLVKIMMTVVRPTKAHGTVLGRRIGHKATLRRVGYLPEHHHFPRYLTGYEALTFYGAMAKMPRQARRRRAWELLETVGMKDWAKTRVGQYSKGMMQRVGLAQALVNDPDLIVLDEPTDGVDPVGRRDIRDVLLHLRSQGKTVFLNSHLLSELEMICDRVAILVDGSVERQGMLDDLTAESQRYEVTVQGDVPDGLCEGQPWRVVSLGDDQSSVVLPGAAAADVQPVIDALRAAGLTIVSVSPKRESLEDLFMRTVEDPGSNDSSRDDGEHST
ncbi:MAG: ABC transporter ATP-binding protein [Phycisphaerales bacterium]|nr:ABC transporter ATP-binding protein [Phycisphaerales bacterium]